VQDAFTQFLTDMKTAMSPGHERAIIIGELLGKSLAQGLRNSDPGLRAEAVAMQGILLDRLKELGVVPGPVSKYGEQATSALAQGLKNKDPEIRDSAEKAQAILDGIYGTGVVKAGTAGAAAGTAYAGGLNTPATAAAAVSAAQSLWQTVAGTLSNLFNVPVVSFGSVGGSGRLGFTAYQEGTDRVPYTGLFGLHKDEMVIRAPEAEAIRHAQAQSPIVATPVATGVRGDTYVTVQVPGLLRARTPDDVARPMRRLAALGLLR
jgi:hypothetical protein